MAIGRPISLTPNIATKNISSLATADQTEFTVTGGYRINEIAVYRNGVRLAEGRDFTASDGDTVNLVTAASASDVIEFAVFDSFNVSDAIVSAASSQNLNGDFNVTGTLYSGDFKPGALTVGVLTASTSLHVGSALTANAAGDVETIGIITAATFSGSGANLTGVASTDNIITGTAATFRDTAVNAGVPNVNIVGLATVGIITAYGAAKLSSTLDVTGAVNIDATTDSTSTTTGALIVDGGLAVAKNVYIGAGLSVAGTLTYQDVTEVDSVGMVTAKSGVNITGGQLQVGTAYSVGYAGVVTAQNVTISAGTIDLKNSGSVSNIKFYCESSNAHYTQLQSAAHAAYGGNVTLTLPTTTDTLIGKTTTDTLTNKTLTSPTLTTPVFSGAATGELKVGSGITMAATSGVVTFANGSTTTNALHFGTPAELKIYHDGGNHYIRGEGDGLLSMRQVGTGIVELYSNTDARLRVNGGETAVYCNYNGSVDLYHNNNKKLETTSSGVSVTGTVAATNYTGDGSALTGVGGEFDITSCLFV